MVDLLELEVWMNRVIDASGYRELWKRVDVFDTSVEMSGPKDSWKQVVTAIGFVRGGVNFYIIGMIFDLDGRLLKYEICDVGDYVESGVMEESARQMGINRKEGFEYVVKNISRVLGESGVMREWL